MREYESSDVETVTRPPVVPSRGPTPAPRTTPPTPAERSKGEYGTLRGLWRRRIFLVDKRTQLRAAVLTTSVTFILLVLLNVSLTITRDEATERSLADYPEFAAAIREENRVESLLVLGASAFFLVGVFLVTILETHKTCGAARKLAMGINRITAGEFGRKVRLRKDDNLMGIEQAVNDLSLSLRQLTERDVEMLDRMAAFAEGAHSADDLQSISEALREEAARKRHLLA